MIMSFDSPGAVGIIQDRPGHELPLDAWSDGRNVRFQDGYVELMAGESSAFASVTTSTTPYWLLPVQTVTTQYWAYCGASAIYATDMSTQADISRTAGYAMSPNIGWNGCAFSGYGIFNNGVNPPQSWAPGLANDCQDLVYDQSAGISWGSASAFCTIIRPFKEFLIAMDYTEGANRNPRGIWWSHPAESGALPYTWDYTKPAYDAGQNELAETAAPIIDCLPLRDSNVIYKLDSVYRQDFIGAPQIFSFRREFESFGALSRHCIKGFFGKHLVFSTDNVILHDLQTVDQVFSRKINKWIYNQIDSTYYKNSFVSLNYPKNEMWVCFPGGGSTYCNYAVIWNWKENTTTIRELNGLVSFIDSGVVDPGAVGSTFDGVSGSFDSDVGFFDETIYNPTQKRLLIAKTNPPGLLLGDEGLDFAGSPITAYVERTGLPLYRQSSRGDITADLQKVKYIKRIYPRIRGAVGETVNIYVAGQMTIQSTPSWQGPYAFTIGTDYKLDVRIHGRLMGIRFETVGADSQWKLDGYDVEFDFEGDR